MKKSYLGGLLLVIMFSFLVTTQARGNLKDTTLEYWSPRGGIVDYNSVTFEWIIHSLDEVKSVTLFVFPARKTADGEGYANALDFPERRFVFTGNDSKEMSFPITDLLPDRPYNWLLGVTTTAGTGTFVGFQGELYHEVEPSSIAIEALLGKIRGLGQFEMK